MLVVKEYESLLEAYGKAGGNLDALENREVGNLVIHKNKVLSVNEADGIKVKTEETKSGVNIYFLVEEGVKIKYPVHLCFGVLPQEGLQEITLKVEAQDNSEVNVIAHCIFPNAVDVTHKMDADIKIGDNARFSYRETHYHGEFGGIKVIPKAKIRVGKKGVWESTFTLIEGCVGMLDYDFEIFGGEKSTSELLVKVFGKKEDDIRITEKIHLDGKEARGLAKSRLVLIDNAKAVVRGETYGNAPFARGHVDCLEIVNGDGVIASAIPVVYVSDRQAKVTHEAAIGSVDKKQMQTLMARGLNEEEAVDVIVKGILR
ncbi:MAG: ABC transporter ATP-binding protein [Chloroflexi bacterium CG15_BIG_FIL_POST_REV_8_21_14_020_46_15]|nr:MAG: ABC transporter ATP-binding protein [Dehalococcoidia bacterium CG2_30_46_19]PIW40606.1 MAG: ABC transporter ATP-binding protein [Chloroflexi bacterium CG15_BIG_FIL_POST_REV_8_21_14_020_46_15]